jgi:hypothetical protein
MQEYRKVKKIITSWYPSQNEALCSTQHVDIPFEVPGLPLKEMNFNAFSSIIDVCSDTLHQQSGSSVLDIPSDILQQQSGKENNCDEFSSTGASESDNNWDLDSEIYTRFDAVCFDEAESDNSDGYDDINLLQDLQDWTRMFKVTTVAVDALLKILQRSHPHLPSTSRTLMKSQSNRSGIVAINSGQYCHFGLLNGLLQFKDQLLKSDASVIYYQVNIDGLPLYKSSSVQLWPILGKLLNSTCPFLIGIFCESGKPTNIDEFLCSFVNESKLLAEEGLTIENRKFLAKVACFICDAPARAFIKQIKSHTGYYSCERCMQKGDFCNGRLTFLELDSEKRLDDDFSAMKYKKHQTGTSPLLKLNVGLVSGCILDSMHLLHLGVVRRLILYG